MQVDVEVTVTSAVTVRRGDVPLTGQSPALTPLSVCSDPTL